ncbi:tRNA threonylcarbamoyladenosine biosynthesis protein TsaB [bacterium BMS3Bbin12]|nr:tRNA threonylcarbamoyladenosine biosynthesis protein TsaB [bacterium BMS3Abin12]GBE48394.1 tRNA threonylcarbamoyladenosine biosynthesis protein TsaB [bacterium BMS3Bbin12]GBE50539.1 tRNA threonylcarbamoyladenosine biosynthesis protein TsaB [bacterium BMS3Bbin13]HDK02523.1 tRNA (adenosine(37)-N6)-threonylcarbamoyltransferase complex dimerization subunit type 1 TsaB [Gammaproteobacteria bacterium]HDO33807.1 tRNA (adenosine(37)-N6)-threonylcarbamoyltransferase complex dimerization subunit type 
MKLLAIETATEACSAALVYDGAVAERFVIAPREHARRILGMIEELLAEASLTLAGLDAIAFGRGPGAFTGVRIAASVTQGLAFGADLPVIPVSTLHALAVGVQRVHGRDAVLAAFDARMGEVYWGAYLRGAGPAIGPVGGERVVAPDSVPLPGGTDWYGAGSGFDRYPQRLAARLGPVLAGVVAGCLPRARDVAAIGVEALRTGAGVPAEQALPVYLRDEVVTTRAGGAPGAGRS